MGQHPSGLLRWLVTWLHGWVVKLTECWLQQTTEDGLTTTNSEETIGLCEVSTNNAVVPPIALIVLLCVRR
jgi:hypothetical protein